MDLFQNNDYLLFDGAMGTYLEKKNTRAASTGAN